MLVKVRRHAWAAMRRVRVGFGRITERALYSGSARSTSIRMPVIGRGLAGAATRLSSTSAGTGHRVFSESWGSFVSDRPGGRLSESNDAEPGCCDDSEQ